MQQMFSGCASLSSLPSIYKWDINNVSNMLNIFFGCSQKVVSYQLLFKYEMNN